MRRTAIFLLLALVHMAAALRARPVVSGALLDPAGAPLSDVQVELLPVLSAFEAGRLRLEGRDLPPPQATARSDAQGRFALAAPQAGVWKVVARAAGRVPLQYGPLLLIEDEELPPAQIPRDAGLRLRVVTERGEPLAGIWALASAVAEGAPRAAGWRPEVRIGRTSADGLLALPRAEGERLRVSAAGSTRTQEVGPDVLEATVRIGREMRTIPLQVVAPDGSPVAGVLIRMGSHAWPIGLTAADGTAPLTVREGQEETVDILLAAPDGRQQLFRLGGKQTLTLAPAVRVTGKVLDASTGKGLAGAAVWLETDPAVLLRTDREGRYTAAAPAGGRLTLGVRASGFLPRELTVTSSEAARGRLPTLALDRAAAIRGLVTGRDGRPLPGASVVAVNAASLGPRTFSPLDPVADRAAAGADGRFELRRLRADGEYEIRVAKPGYFPAARVAAAAAIRAAPLQVRLQTACGVHGSLLDPRGQAVAGARVLLRPALRPGRERPLEDEPEPAAIAGMTADSGEAGRFTVPESPAAEVDLEARKAGYAPALRRGIRLGACTASFDLGTVVLQPGVRLAGRVVDRRGRPIAGAELFLVDRLPSRATWEPALKRGEPDAESGRDGSFAVNDLARGIPLHLLVKAEGYLAAAVRGVRPPVPGPLLVRMDPAAALRGRVIDEAGEGVSGARINLTWQEVLADDPRGRPVGQPIERSALADAEGRFEIGDSPTGEVSLDVRAQGFIPVESFAAVVPAPDPARELTVKLRRGARLEGRVTTTAAEPVAGARVSSGGVAAYTDAEGVYAVDGVPPGPGEVAVAHPDYRRQVRPLQIEEGANRLDIELDGGFRVAGRVVDGEGRPVAAAQVELTTRSRAELRVHRGRTDADGGFALAPVASGRYSLEATAAGFASATLAEPVVVSNQPVEGLEVVLRQGATVGGRVLGLSAEELAAVSVKAHGEEGEERAAVLDAEGLFEVRDLPPGDWLLRASLWQGQRQVEVRVPIAPADRQLVRDLEFSRRVTLSGRVTFEDEPLAGSQISVRGERFGVERSVASSFDGSFVLQDLEPDRYWLGVNDPQRLLAHNDTLDVLEDREVTIRIEAAVVAGRIEEAGSGDPVPEASLTLRPTAGTDFMIGDGSLADGSFRIIQVPPGSYRLTAQAKGYAPAEREIRLAEGEELTGIEVSLTATAGLEIQVHLASGAVPSLVHVQARSAQGAPILAASYPPAVSGSIELASLPAGTWQLVVGAEGGAVVTETVTVPGKPHPIALPGAGALHVRIPELASQNLLATLSLVGQDQQPFWTLGFGGSVEQSWIMRGGKATVGGLPAGQWHHVAEAANGRVWQGTVVTSGAGDVAISLD